MLDRRGFLAALLGAAVAPKDILSGIVTPAPIKKAVDEYAGWVFVWKSVNKTILPDGTVCSSECKFFVPEEVAHIFKRDGSWES